MHVHPLYHQLCIPFKWRLDNPNQNLPGIIPLSHTGTTPTLITLATALFQVRALPNAKENSHIEEVTKTNCKSGSGVLRTSHK